LHDFLRYGKADRTLTVDISTEFSEVEGHEITSKRPWTTWKFYNSW